MINTNDPYMAYYRNQVGGSVSSVFRGGNADSNHQRGHGIGSFLGGLFRSVMPIIKSSASAVGKEALRSGVGFLGDVVKTGDARQAANTHLKEFTTGLKRRADNKLDRVLQGRGASVAYKKRRVARVTPQSLANLLRVRSTAEKRQKSVTSTQQRTKKRQVKKKNKTVSKKRKTQAAKRKQQQRRRQKKKIVRKDIFD